MQTLNIHTTINYKNPLIQSFHSNQQVQSLLLYGGPRKQELVSSFTNTVLGSNKLNHPDLLHLKQDKILVDDIRHLNSFLYKTSLYDNYRIAIIDSISNMNTNAMHALLKILEEPPNKAIIILMNDHLHNVIATIRSRCHKFYVPDKSNPQKIDIKLYQEVLKCFKDSNTPNIGDQKSFDEILSLLQLLILRIIKTKLIEIPTSELYEGEVLDLQSFDICITSLYKRWEEILNFSTNKLHLPKDQIVMTLFESRI